MIVYIDINGYSLLEDAGLRGCRGTFDSSDPSSRIRR